MGVNTSLTEIKKAIFYEHAIYCLLIQVVRPTQVGLKLQAICYFSTGLKIQARLFHVVKRGVGLC